MHAVEAADDEVVDHVHHRFGDRVLRAPGLEGIHPFLHHDVGDGLSFLHARHFVALFAIERTHLIGTLDRHDGHAVGAGVGLDDGEGLLVDPVLAVFDAGRRQHFFDVIGQALLARAFFEIDLAALAEDRIDEPWIDLDQVGEFRGDAVIVGEVIRLQALPPSERQRRGDGLFEVLQDRRQAAGEIVIEQHEAGIEVGYRNLVVPAHDRFECKTSSGGKFDGFRFAQIGQQRAEPHAQAGHGQDFDEGGEAFEVEKVTRVVLGNDQHATGARTDALERRLDCLHRQRLEGRVEIVEPGRKQVGVHRRQLETGIAQIHRTIKGRRGLQPLGTEPALDSGLVLQQVGFNLLQRPGQGRGQMWNGRPRVVTHGSLVLAS